MLWFSTDFPDIENQVDLSPRHYRLIKHPVKITFSTAYNTAPFEIILRSPLPISYPKNVIIIDKKQIIKKIRMDKREITFVTPSLACKNNVKVSVNKNKISANITFIEKGQIIPIGA